MKDFLRRYQERRNKPNIDLSKYLVLIKTLYKTKAMIQKLKGYKTYITGAIAIATAFGAWINDSISVNELAVAIFAAIQSMNIRNALQ